MEATQTNGTEAAVLGGAQDQLAPLKLKLSAKEMDLYEVNFELVGVTPYSASRLDGMFLAKEAGIVPKDASHPDDEEDEVAAAGAAKSPKTKTKSGAPPKKKRSAQELFESARYLNDKGEDCIPGRGVRKALATAAASYHDDVYMREVFGQVRVHAKYLPIMDAEGRPVTRPTLEIVGVGKEQGTRHTAVPAVRALYPEWRISVPVVFWAQKMSIDDLLELFTIAGHAVGLGAGRVEKGGEGGSFRTQKVSVAAVYSRYGALTDRDIRILKGEMRNMRGTANG